MTPLQTAIAETPPRNALPLVARPELRMRLLAGLDGQVVLVEAPAGFGKTETLATTFRTAERRNRRAFWFDLGADPGPQELIARVAARTGASAPSIEAIRAAIAASAVPVELYFDQVGGREGWPLAGLFERPPEPLRIVIAGRRLPGLRLSRMRQRGLLMRIDARELAFTRAETAQLLRSWFAPEALETMTERLAGWPALTQLARIACETSGGPPPGLIEGNAEVFREFLAEEVFPELDAPALALFGAVQGVESFTASIAARLAESAQEAHVARRIGELYPLMLPERQNTGWFRVNPMVAAALHLVLPPEDACRRQARHIRAAHLFAAQGSLEKSVLHASLAGDQDLVVHTIEAAGGVNLFLRAGYTVLRDILEAVQHEVVTRTPSLRLCRGVMLAKSGRVLEARAQIDELIADTRSGAIVATPAWEAALRHISSLNEVYEDRALDEAGIAALLGSAESERQENTWQRAWIFNHLTIAYTRMGELEMAISCGLRALSLYQEERASYPQVFMLAHLGYAHYRANRIERALDCLGQSQNLLRRRHWDDRNLLALADVPLAAVRYLQGDLPEVRRLLEPDLPIMANGEGWGDFFVQGYSALARARFAEEGWASAQDCLQDGLATADARGLARLRLSLSILRAELLTRDGQREAALTTVRTWPELNDPVAWPTPRERREAALVLARLALRAGQIDEALVRLRDLATEARRTQRWNLLIRVSLLLCETHARLDQPDEALAALEEAARLSQSGNQVQQYRDEGAEFAEQVRRLMRRTGIGRLSPVATQYVVAAAPGPKRRGQATGLLSQREAEILADLAEGLPNKAIAHRHEISEATVKFHLKNLYAKLGVGRRSLAISAARKSGLID